MTSLDVMLLAQKYSWFLLELILNLVHANHKPKERQQTIYSSHA